MLKIEFETQMSRLVDYFGAGTFDRKSDHYWRKLERFSEEELLQAVDRVLDEGKQFPSVNQIKAAIYRVRENKPKATLEKQECSICDGYGWVLSETGAMRGRCVHGDTLSQSIPLAPLKSKQKRTTSTHDAFLAWAAEDPMKAFNGFLKTEKILKHLNPKAWEEIARSLADLIGRDRARELWKKRPELLEDITTPPMRERTDRAALNHYTNDSSAAPVEITTPKKGTLCKH